MKEMLEIYRRTMPQRDQGRSRLLAEIAYLEARLIAIGQTGDCAYERALARSYRELLSLRRQELTAQHSPDATNPAGAFLAQSARYLQLS